MAFATSPMFGTTAAGSGTVVFKYDALDNLTQLTMPATDTSPARNQYYCYDSTTRRLASLRSAANCGGTVQTSLTYDARGNIATKDGRTFDFDLTNRLKSIDNGGVVENYRYDGYGLRALKNAASGNIWSQYTHDGRLLQEVNARTDIQTEYVYLGGSLVAQRETPTTGGATVVKYQHTDALGTPVAVTNASRTVLTRNEYEPYGQLINHAITDAVGFTGHVQDAMSGLTYMQQRYYDPMIGRFLSVDPVTATSVGGNFNRYWYANDNPYRFTDPDGRKADKKYDPSKWKGRDWSSLTAHSSNGLTAPTHQLSGSVDRARSGGDSNGAQVTDSQMAAMASSVRRGFDQGKDDASKHLDAYCKNNSDDCAGATSSDLASARIKWSPRLFYKNELQSDEDGSWTGESIDRSTNPPTIILYAGGIALGFGPNSNGVANVLVHALRHVSPYGTELSERSTGEYMDRESERDAFGFQKRVMGADYHGP